MRSRTITIATVLTGLFVCFHLVCAANTGAIRGRVTDKATGDPLVGVTVILVGTNMGAMTDPDGRYQILRVAPGAYALRFSSAGYTAVKATKVAVDADATVTVDAALAADATELNNVITVKSTRKIIDPCVTGGEVSITSETMESRPVQTVDALLEQVAGVVTTAEGEIFVRGGRSSEVAYIVDGVPLSNPLGGAGSVGARRCLTPPPAHGGSAIVNGEPYDAMFFENYGVNPFVDTEDDHLSTFAVDVDNASYVLARSYLDDGNLPNKNAVRVEEFINHFDYRYDTPESGAFKVAFEVAPSRYGTPSTWLMKVGIQGRIIRPEHRKAANLVFVIDVSGSMSRENRLGLVKRSLAMLVNGLTAEDSVGIVTYGSVGLEYMRPVSAGSRSHILRYINALQPGGSTYAEHGILRL